MGKITMFQELKRETHQEAEAAEAKAAEAKEVKEAPAGWDDMGEIDLATLLYVFNV